MELQHEDASLKKIVRTKLDSETSVKLLAECNAMEQLPNCIIEACSEHTDVDGQDYSLIKNFKWNLWMRRMWCGMNGPITPDLWAKASTKVVDRQHYILDKSIKQVCG